MRETRNRRLKAFAPFGLLAMVAVIAVFGSSCTPDSGITAAESDVVVTVYDKNAPWGTLKTYSMPDSIASISDPNDPNPPTSNTQNDQAILQLIEDSFAKYGWTRETNPAANPQVEVLVGKIATTNYDVYGGFGYWGWYGWGGYGYPCCTGTVTSFTVGSIMIVMGDPANANPSDDTVPLLWIAGLNGVVTGSTQSLTQRVQDGINQAFKQSEYLLVTN